MEKYFELTIEEQSQLIENVFNETKISHAVIEKDFWLCLILNFMFNISKYKKYFTFKGGTCLAKCYKLINRFSEDIDIGIEFNKLVDFEIKDNLSTNQKNKIIDKIRILENNFVKNKFIPELNLYLNEKLKQNVTFSFDETDCSLLINYKKHYSNQALINSILIEFGSMACQEPANLIAISPIISQVYKNLFKTSSFNVKAVTLI